MHTYIITTYILILCIHTQTYIYVCVCVTLFVTLKKVYDRNVVNKYRLYLLLGVIILNLIDYVYIYNTK